MREAALTGMTRAEVSRHLAAELLYAPDAKLRSFQFIDEAGNEYDLTATKYIFNHFDNTFEFNKLTVAKHG